MRQGFRNNEYGADEAAEDIGWQQAIRPGESHHRAARHLPDVSVTGSAMSIPSHIPVFFLSGFLGAGKSTVLNRLLTDPDFSDTAVIINEFGDVPIDHLLVRKGETNISQVSTGCLCCSGVSDLRATLFDLHCAAAGSLCPPFSRVIVEMSGLGDPAPLVNALTPTGGRPETLRDKTVDGIFRLSGFVTLYDIINGPMSLERHFEALKQVAFADQIVLTKTDLARDPATKADLAALPDELKQLNAVATIHDKRDIALPILFARRSYNTVEQSDEVAGWLALEAVLAADTNGHQQGRNFDVKRHGAGINTFSIVHDQPIPEKRFRTFLCVLQDAAGPRLLRAKGIVSIAETPQQPRIIHIVQHVASPPVKLDAWPDEDHRTRLVFITNGIDPGPVKEVFSSLINDSSRPFKDVIASLSRGFFDAVLVHINRIIHLSRR